MPSSIISVYNVTERGTPLALHCDSRTGAVILPRREVALGREALGAGTPKSGFWLIARSSAVPMCESVESSVM
jgi:hypothetical protein